MEKYKSFEVRLLPTKKQEIKMWNHVNCVRKVKNMYIEYCYNKLNNKELLNKGEYKKHFTQLIKTPEYLYLKTVSKRSLTLGIDHVHESFVRYFQKTHGKPKFKSRKTSKKSFCIKDDFPNFRRIKENTFRIEKIGDVKISRGSLKNNKSLIEAIEKIDKFRKTTIYHDGKFWVMQILYRYDLVSNNHANKLTDEVIGIDLGVTDLATCSNKIKYKNINRTGKIVKLEKRFKRLQRKCHKKYSMNKVGNTYVKTKNIEKLEKELILIQRKIKNIRQNHNHYITTEIVNRLPQEIVIEDLNIDGMKKVKRLAKKVSENRFFQIRRYLEYKCDDRGILLTVADRWYPSTQTCSKCGERKQGIDKLNLNNKVFSCSCGNVINRDLNAAINLKNYRHSEWYENEIVNR